MIWLTWYYKKMNLPPEVVCQRAGITLERLREIEACEELPTTKELCCLAAVIGWPKPSDMLFEVPADAVRALHEL